MISGGIEVLLLHGTVIVPGLLETKSGEDRLVN